MTNAALDAVSRPLLLTRYPRTLRNILIHNPSLPPCTVTSTQHQNCSYLAYCCVHSLLTWIALQEMSQLNVSFEPFHRAAGVRCFRSRHLPFLVSLPVFRDTVVQWVVGVRRRQERLDREQYGADLQGGRPLVCCGVDEA